MSTAGGILRARTGLLFLAVFAVQIGSHLVWLPLATQVGQVTMPWLLNQGFRLYSDIYENRAPGITWTLALVQRVSPISEMDTLVTVNLVMVLLTGWLVFGLAQRLAGAWWAGAVALLVWAWWEPVYGNVLFYFDSVLGFLALLAVAVWTLGSNWRPGWLVPLLTGFFLGCGILVKQHGWAIAAVFGLWVLVWGARHRLRDVSFGIVGIALIPVFVALLEASRGNLANHIYWTYTFNLADLPPLPPTGSFVYKMLLAHLFAPVFFLLLIRERPRGWMPVGLVYLAAAVTLGPRTGEIHAMTQLPLLAVMTGAAVSRVSLPRFVAMRPADLTLIGVTGMALLGWLWAGAVSYVPTMLGPGGIPAYDEFQPVADILNAEREPNDTLYVLPAMDGNPQLHVMTNMPPPGVFTTTHDWFLAAPGVLERIQIEWQEAPPTYLVFFPDLLAESPAVGPLVDWMHTHYEQIDTIPDIPFNGKAQIFRYDAERS